MNLEPLCIPGQPESLSQLLDYVTWAAAAFGLDEIATYRLSLAVDEIATNIVMHDYEDAQHAGDLTIWAETEENRLIIYLEDTGRPFDPRTAPRPADLDRPLEERQDGGLGIFLALWGVDDFIYERIGQTNRCAFVMYLPGDVAGSPGEIGP
jgi:anti-sigma regulatory factor (Ser/Thr protein kinase)